MARPSNRGSGVPSFAILMLLNELFRAASSHGLPPVTAFAIAGQVLLFMGYIQAPWGDVWNICISVDKAYYRGDWKRLIFSAFEHGDDWHLYYNMVSFMWKGRDLEKKFGSGRFFFILAVFTALTGCTYVGLNMTLAELTGDRSHLKSCAVGFSGVIFALKVLTTHYNTGQSRQSMFGIPLPGKYAYWAELVIIQLVSPNASFVGHLAGILVGLAYTKGPLKYFMDVIEAFVTGDASATRTPRTSSAYTSSGRTSGTSGRSDYSSYTNGMSEEEQMRQATQESMREARNQRFQPSSPQYPRNYPDLST